MHSLSAETQEKVQFMKVQGPNPYGYNGQEPFNFSKVNFLHINSKNLHSHTYIPTKLYKFSTITHKYL